MKKGNMLHRSFLFFALVAASLTLFTRALPAQEQFLRYGIYYGNSKNTEVRQTDWSAFDLMILNPGNPGNKYQNLDDVGFLIMMQNMKENGVSVFFYLDIGCEKDLEGKHYSQTDRESWLEFKKREIDIFMRYADGVYFDCVGPFHEKQVYSDQFGRDVQELVDYVHYARGEVIIGDLWSLMEWVNSNDEDLVPYEADYVLIKGAWSMTPDQYSDDWGPLQAISFARTHNLKILGLDYVREGDRERLMYCYCASRIFGFSGVYYSEGNLYEGLTQVDVPYDLGLPQGNYRFEEGRYIREFKRGIVYMDMQTHRGWIEGEAQEEVGLSVILVIMGIVAGLYLFRGTEV